METEPDTYYFVTVVVTVFVTALSCVFFLAGYALWRVLKKVERLEGKHDSGK